MARVTGFAKRSGNRAERIRANSEPCGEPVPLDLWPVIEPYEDHRGLSVRVERLAHGARLSKGRNNGDRSWSLAPDELDELEYLPPAGAYEAHKLAIRLISLEGSSGATLALIDFPIAAHVPSQAEAGAPSIAAENPMDIADPDAQKLREELAQVRLSLATRDAELARIRSAAEEADRSRQELMTQFAAAEAAWDRELQERLSAAAADAKANLEKSRAAWELEQNVRGFRSAATAETAVEEARKRWQQEADAALAKAKESWKVDGAARLGAAEKAAAELRERAERAEAALAGASAAQPDDKEVRRLRQQLAGIEANLANRTAELAEARAAAELARARSQDVPAELRKAEQAWKAGEAARLAAAESHWKDRSAKAMAEAAARLEQTEAAVAEARAQAEARLHQMTALQTSLSARDTELAQMRAALDEARARSSGEADVAREHWQHEMDAALAQAQETWKANEAARLSAAELQWKAQLAAAVAETTAQLQRVESELAEAHSEAQAQRDSADAELRRLRDDLATAHAALAAHESELAEARTFADQARTTADESLEGVAAEIEKARQQWKKEAAVTLAKAEKAWRAEEAPRLAAAEAQWQEQVEVRLAEANERIEHAETALANARDCSEALRHELAAAQASLANRDIELAEARAFAERERDRWMEAPAEAQERKPSWQADRDDRRMLFRRRLIRDLAVVTCLSGLAIMLFPRVQPVVAEAWPQSLSLHDNIQPLLQMAGLASEPAPEQAPVAEPHALVDVRVANLRERPSTASAVVTKLARNAEVVPVEHRGSWVYVRIGDGASQQQGWVASSVLKGDDPQPTTHQ
jgi:Bacterial SH3 domain